MLSLIEAGPTNSVEEVLLFENHWRVLLPESYRNFLLRNDGGRPELDVIDIDEFAESPTDVKVFFGLKRSFTTSTLQWNLEHIRSQIPDQALVPIASDSGGNLFCLSADGDSNNGIVYVHFSLNTIYDVASNFEEFCNKLREWVD